MNNHIKLHSYYIVDEIVHKTINRVERKIGNIIKIINLILIIDYNKAGKDSLPYIADLLTNSLFQLINLGFKEYEVITKETKIVSSQLFTIIL